MLVMAEPQEEYYTPVEVGIILQIPPESVTRLIRQEKLPGYKVGNLWRVNKEEFARFMKTQRNKYPLDQES